MLQEQDKAPAFAGPTNNEGHIDSKDLQGQAYLLYFYPKDNTPGCTKQAIYFTENKDTFEDLGIKIIGVSRDSVKKHDNFTTKQNLGIPLISDEDGKICEDFGVWVEKSMYGKKFMGIERSSFLVDAEGTIQNIWRKVKVGKHLEEVLEAAKALNAT